MRWLVTGAAGQLGTDVTAVLKMYGEDVVPCERGMLDISDPDSVQSVLDDAGPDVEVLAEVDGHPVLARQGRILVAAFHPELTDDTRIHELFLTQVGEATSVRA